MAKKVLIIEDDPEILGSLERKLRVRGFDVITAIDGVSGLQKAKSEHPDVIALDVLLPKLNGFTICGILKCDSHFCRIPIIMVTGKFGEEANCFDEAVQPDVYMTKPFSSNSLIGHIRRLSKHA